MNFNEIVTLCKKGKTAMLPNYIGYFDWSFSKKKMYFHRDNYKRDITDQEKERNDWYYII